MPDTDAARRAPLPCTPSNWRAGLLAAVGLATLGVAAVPAQAAGQVDLSGTWQAAKPRTSILPDDNAIPFTAEGRKTYNDNRASKVKKDLEFDQTASRCSAPGTPRIMLTPLRFRIFQDPQVMMMAFEWNHVRRAIGMPGLPPQISLFGAAEDAKLVGTKMGTSLAHWEGNTLVIETKDVSDTTLLDDLVPHSFDMRVTERLTLKDANTLEDRMTIQDPATFTKPLETTLTYTRQPDRIFPEDVCLDRVFGKPPLPTK